jgi:hypothetical protein
MKIKIGKYPDWRWYNTYLYKWFGYAPEQKKKIRIDPWDTWSMDCTLAEIILPMLLQLAKTKHGSPIVDEEDVPDWLHGDTEEDEQLIHDRWDWVMAEMIYAFDCKVNKEEPCVRFDFKTQVEEMEAEQNRIQNGFRLFGKYYEGLWD